MREDETAQLYAETAAGERGFVLPFLMVALAGMALITMATLRQYMTLSDLTAAAQSEFRSELDAANIEARLAFSMTSEPYGQRGIKIGAPRVSVFQEVGGGGADFTLPDTGSRRFASNNAPRQEMLFLDGTEYSHRAPSGGYRVAAQDLAGLVNMNSLAPDQLVRFIAASGVGEIDARRLAAAYTDFTDDDDREGFGGAEQFDYQSRNLPAPPNYRLLTRSGAFSILGWPDTLSSAGKEFIFENGWADLRAHQFNINTAPAGSLAALYNVDRDAAQSAITERRIAPFSSLADISRRIGATVEGEVFVAHTFPSRGVRVRINRANETLTRESVIYISDGGADRPFYVKLNRRFHRNDRQEADRPVAELAPLPRPSRLFADGER